MRDKNLKKRVNDKHIKFYNRTLSILELLLEGVETDIKQADFDSLEVPKNTIATIDFLISSIGKVQKGHRLALGLDDDKLENLEPEINIVEGLAENMI